jgi:hypothetical protein
MIIMLILSNKVNPKNTRGSSRPDLYSADNNHVIEVKSYNVTISLG